MAASGCSEDSDTEAESTPTTTTEQVETQPPAPSAVDIAKLRAAFKERYGEAPWYHHITGMEVGDSVVEITTDRVPKDDFYETATPTLCHAAFKAADLAELDGIKAVHLIHAHGEEGGCA